MFSVIIPVHNKESTLNSSIESVLKQKYEDFELIIINDASTDSSKDIINNYSDERIKYFERDKPGHGGYKARNMGIINSSYNWIAFLDADDYWLDDHLETAKNLIIKYSVTSFIFTGFSIRNKLIEKYNNNMHDDEIINSKILLHKYASYDIFHTNSIVSAKSLLLKAGLFPENKCKRGGDSDLWLRMVMNSKEIAYTTKVTSIYCIDKSSVVSNVNNISMYHPIYDTVNKYINNNTNNSVVLNYIKSLSNRKNIMWYIEMKRAGKFKYKYLKYIYYKNVNTIQILKITYLLIPNILFTYKK